jgi:dTDP-4-dehydrorhamnose 3,5-epimerase
MDGVLCWQSDEIVDERGNFLKSYTHEKSELNIPFSLQEVFTSNSFPGVVRGFHLQVGSSENYRIVQVISGRVLDVLLDLRVDSATYCQLESREFANGLNQTLLIPPGVAHGFQALEESRMLYLSSNKWNPKLDTGVNPISAGFVWPMEISKVSERDAALPTLAEYKTKKL